MTAHSAPFTFGNAFTSNPLGGNPAAIIFLDTNTPLNVLQGIAKNFNQPMAVFVTPIEPLKPGEKVIRSDVRYIAVSGFEVPLCGHGSLVAARALLNSPTFAGNEINEIQFKTQLGVIITIKVLASGGLLEMELPEATLLPVPAEEQKRLTSVVNRAYGKDVNVKNIVRGGEGFEHAILIEMDEAEQLEESKLNNAIIGAETGYEVNIITTAITSKTELNERFVSRMFTALVNGGEDHVCGSAHCLLAPYWYDKSGIERGKEIVARQVSARGGLLNVVLDVGKPTIKLRGETTITSTGVCYFYL